MVTPIDFNSLKDTLVTRTQVDPNNLELLQAAYDSASSELYALVAGEEVNTVKFEAIAKTAIIESTVYRFNRLSEEGMSSATQDGETHAWEEDPIKKWSSKVLETISGNIPWTVRYTGYLNRVGLQYKEFRVPRYDRYMWHYDSDAGHDFRLES